MLALLSLLLIAPAQLAQVAIPPQEVVRSQIVAPLPASLDTIPVFNSNSPELIGGPGILLSTFPPTGMAVPAAHLNFPLNGRFDIFAHHVYKALTPEDLTAMYLAILVQNPGPETVTVAVLSGASYLSQPDAPFIPLPAYVPFSPLHPVFAGPGSRVMGDLLQETRQEILPPQLEIPPGQSVLLLNQPIPVAPFDPPINGRSTLVRLRSNGPVYLASLAHPAIVTETGEALAPTLAQWETVLQTAGLVTPRDRVPTPIAAVPEQVVYGRVAGVAQGIRWAATVTDNELVEQLTLPPRGETVSYGISTLYGGRLGTGQIQSAPMLVRYPDTAYQAHGNYGIEYDLTFPLFNSTPIPQTVTVSFETPIKEDQLSTNGLRFFEPLPTQTFFRGPVQVRYQDDQGLPRIRNLHLVQRRGQRGDPLVTITLQPQERRRVAVRLLYPPDSTPPQVVTIQTLQGEPE